MKKILYICLALSVVILGCKKQDEIALEINGERVVIRKDDYNMRVFNDGKLITRIFFAEDRYHVNVYGNEFESLVVDYEKWDFAPEAISRFVERDGNRYIIVYDEEGRISEEVFVDAAN
jgi:hypothetical protein